MRRRRQIANSFVVTVLVCRTAAHHAWRNVTLLCSPQELGGSEGGAGVLALPPVTAAVAGYYTAMTKHKNHMVCEAACAAIAELGEREVPGWLSLSLLSLLVR